MRNIERADLHNVHTPVGADGYCIDLITYRTTESMADSKTT